MRSSWRRSWHYMADIKIMLVFWIQDHHLRPLSLLHHLHPLPKVVPKAHALMVHDLAVLEQEILLVFRSPTPSSSLNYEDGGFSAVQLLAAKNGGPSWPQPRTSWTMTASGRPSRFCSTSRSCTGLQRLHRLHMDMALRTSSTWRKRTPGDVKIGGMMEHPGRLLPGRRVPNGQKNLMEKFPWQRIQHLLILKP